MNLVWLLLHYAFKRQSHKMVKHTQTIRRQIVDELFECAWPFCEIGAKRLMVDNTVRGPKIVTVLKFMLYTIQRILI